MATKQRQAEDARAAYNADFYRWTQSTAEMLRQGRIAEVGLEIVAEEIADMGRRDYREVQSRMIVLLMHLLKWQLQPGLQASSWRSNIAEQRMQLLLVMADSPSLRRIPSEELPSIYRTALRAAVAEIGLSPDRFPVSCPYTPEQLLDHDFFPSV